MIDFEKYAAIPHLIKSLNNIKEFRGGAVLTFFKRFFFLLLLLYLINDGMLIIYRFRDHSPALKLTNRVINAWQ